MCMHKNFKNQKGSIAFILYFIAGLTILAVAGYYIGLNQQSSLFRDVSGRKQQQLDSVLNGPVDSQQSASSDNQNSIDPSVKSLIDSPNIVLRNIGHIDNSNINNASSASSNINATTTYSPGTDDQKTEETKAISYLAKNSKYFIVTSENKNGLNITLKNGEDRGNTCYNTATQRVCYPDYKFGNVWSLGDLNNDGIDDAVINVSAIENVSSKEIKTENYYVMVSSLDKTTASSSVKYTIVPFNFGLYFPIISSIEISDNLISLMGSFYDKKDTLGQPSVNQVVKYAIGLDNTVKSSVATSTLIGTSSVKTASSVASSSSVSLNSDLVYIIKKVSSSRLFKEQKDNLSDWYPYNYTFNNLDFSFKTPDAWQKNENFKDGFSIDFKTTDGRGISFSASTLVKTCSEYQFDLKDTPNITIKSTEFVDLGSSGIGYYTKFYGKLSDSSNGYETDICVTDKNNDRELFSLYSSSNEDGDPYFAMFDKIFSTFKIKQ